MNEKSKKENNFLGQEETEQEAALTANLTNAFSPYPDSITFKQAAAAVGCSYSSIYREKDELLREGIAFLIRDSLRINKDAFVRWIVKRNLEKTP